MSEIAGKPSKMNERKYQSKETLEKNNYICIYEYWMHSALKFGKKVQGFFKNLNSDDSYTRNVDF